MNCCIIGKGSIGQRHSSILRELKTKVFFLRRNPNKYENNEISFKDIFSKKIDFFIISNPSSLHLKTIKKLIVFNKPIFVEKPFVTQEKISKKIKTYKKIFVLYQMRFDPRIKFIKKKITHTKVTTANFIWKTFLPKWHKNENFKKSYAARKELGGGVIFTMSHEIDTAINLLGNVKSVLVKKNKNKLKINVEDNVQINLEHFQGTKSKIILDFYSSKKIRQFEIQSDKKNFKWNFFNNYVQINNKYIHFKMINDKIYFYQIKSILLTIKNKDYINSPIHLNKILHTQKVLNACVQSLNKKKLVRVYDQ